MISTLILALDRQRLPDEWLPDCGYLSIDQKSIETELNQLTPHWRPRADLETDPRFKQPIPYLLLSKEDGRMGCYARDGGETRLKGRYSVGIGGHVECGDRQDTLWNTLQAAALREIAEEVGAAFDTADMKLIGVINEEQSTVGRVHLGFVFHIQIKELGKVQPSGELIDFHWSLAEELEQMDLETWSRLALRLLSKSRCS